MKKGFTLIELMIVVAIIAFLAMISMPSFMGFLAKAKRSEAYLNLHALYAAEKAYWAEHGRYTNILYGKDGLGWKPEGYQGGGSQEKFYYTYGFGNGSEGKNFFTGNLATSSSYLNKAYADTNGFLIIAAADITGSGNPDIISVDQFNNITLLNDALAG